MRNNAIILGTVLALTFVSCKKDDDKGTAGTGGNNCLADKITLTETKLQDLASSNTIIVDFDAKNTGTQDYDVQKGSKAITLRFVVTTTDDATYESTAPLTATKISAGSTAVATAAAEYAPGKTFKSYTVTHYCN